MNKCQDLEQGFTLLEVIVAIVIITSLVATFAPLIISSVERIKWAGKRTQELYSLRSAMEMNLALEKATRSQSITISGPNSYSRTIDGIVVQVGEFVSFLSPRP